MSREAQTVFLHPIGLDARAADGFGIARLVAPSLPGHGDRARARAGLTLGDMADEVVGWTSGRLHVIGVSMGGMVAMHLALRHPERIASLLLCATTARADREVTMRRAEDVERRGSAALVDETLQRWFSPETLALVPEPDGVAYARERLNLTPAPVLADGWRAIAQQDVLDDLSGIRAPVTCVAGSRDRSTPTEALERIAERIQGARLTVVEQPHMGFLEAPTEFHALVTDHLEWAEAA